MVMWSVVLQSFVFDRCWKHLKFGKYVSSISHLKESRSMRGRIRKQVSAEENTGIKATMVT